MSKYCSIQWIIKSASVIAANNDAFRPINYSNKDDRTKKYNLVLKQNGDLHLGNNMNSAGDNYGFKFKVLTTFRN